MTAHAENGMNAVLVGLDMGVSVRNADLGELRELAASAGLNPIVVVRTLSLCGRGVTGGR